MKIKFLAMIFVAGPLVACSTIESDPRSDASQPMQTKEFDMAPKDDTCCIKFGPSGKCLQEKSPGCSSKENLNIKKPQE